jgi:hypothetical protein
MSGDNASMPRVVDPPPQLPGDPLRQNDHEHEHPTPSPTEVPVEPRPPHPSPDPKEVTTEQRPPHPRDPKPSHHPARSAAAATARRWPLRGFALRAVERAER